MTLRRLDRIDYFAYIELNPELSGSRVEDAPLPINDGDVPVLPPPLVPNLFDTFRH